jgi:hypothetical protein
LDKPCSVDSVLDWVLGKLPGDFKRASLALGGLLGCFRGGAYSVRALFVGRMLSGRIFGRHVFAPMACLCASPRFVGANVSCIRAVPSLFCGLWHLGRICYLLCKGRGRWGDIAVSLLKKRGLRAGLAFYVSFVALSSAMFGGTRFELGLGMGQNEPEFAFVFSAVIGIFWFLGAFWAGTVIPLGFALGGYAKDLSSLIKGPFQDNGIARLMITILAMLVSFALELFSWAVKKSAKTKANKETDSLT